MIEVYQANLSHLNSLHQLFDQYREFYQVKPASVLSLDFVKQRLVKKDSIVLIAHHVARHAQHAAGFVQIYPSYSSVAMRPIWLLNDLFVGAKFRRLGIARKLLETVHTKASEQGIFSIKLATGIDNKSAKQLYRSMNYQLIDQFEHFSWKVD